MKVCGQLRLGSAKLKIIYKTSNVNRIAGSLHKVDELERTDGKYGVIHAGFRGF